MIVRFVGNIGEIWWP